MAKWSVGFVRRLGPPANGARPLTPFWVGRVLLQEPLLEDLVPFGEQEILLGEGSYIDYRKKRVPTYSILSGGPSGEAVSALARFCWLRSFFCLLFFPRYGFFVWLRLLIS